ncbi:hypothetical protein WJX81_002324 [Elliptochloris bilobata]|uniref:NADH:ubiquinone reductase (non-electrogenic) n=1 Tax=Elliptochloris bilobata TaxID=381761 RepID=A0AAW1RWW2_9CHLO
MWALPGRALLSWPVGAVLAGASCYYLDQPAHLVSKTTAAGVGAFSGAVATYAWRLPQKGRGWGRSLLLGSQALNATLQAYQLGRAGLYDLTVDGNLLPKTKVVVLGSGWGAGTFVKNLAKRVTGRDGWYDVTIVSPRNFFTYTPLLPGAATGTVELRSITEAVRSLVAGTGIKYMEAQCIGIDTVNKTIMCSYNKAFRDLGEAHTFTVPYDVLVFATGAVTNTFRTPGCEEHSYFLKEASHAHAIRQRINECFEVASLPDTTAEQRKKLLSFIVVRGGPTGVETAAELHDMFAEDLLPRYFPDLKEDVSIKLIDTKDHLLSCYDRAISDYTGAFFKRQGIQVLSESHVSSVDGDGVMIKCKGDTERRVAGRTVIWAAGIGPNTLTQALAAQLPQQGNVRALKTDRWLAVRGSDSIFALGDAATIAQDRALEHAAELFVQGDTDGNGRLSCSEIAVLMDKAQSEYPQLKEHSLYFDCKEAADGNVRTDAWLPAWLQGGAAKGAAPPTAGHKQAQEEAPVQPPEVGLGDAVADPNADREITLEQFKEQLRRIDQTLRALPATAQVASQQGNYLASVFNAHRIPPVGGTERLCDIAAPFKYHHSGNFAYIGGDRAVLEIASDPDKNLGVFTGFLAGIAWKGTETFKQISLKNQWLVSRDWLKTKLLGRDISDRAASKITFPDVWTNTCCSHPLHGHTPSEVDRPEDVASGAVPGAQRAALRKLWHELGIAPEALSAGGFRFLTRLQYCAADHDTYGPDAEWGEHEVDYILFARAEVALDPNPDEVSAVRYVDAAALRAMMASGSGLRWSPWFRLIAEHFLDRWWADLDRTLGTDDFVDVERIHRLQC